MPNLPFAPSTPTSALDGFDPNANDVVRVVVVQPDGKILIGGDFTTLTPNGGGAVTRNGIARLNPDGTLDTAFNPDAGGSVYAIAVQADGMILVGGGLGIARLNPNGTLDTTFDVHADGDVVHSIAVQADGGILVGGDFSHLSSNGDFSLGHCIARVNPNGTIDTAFNGNASDWIFSIAVQAGGKILVGGWFTFIDGQPRNHIARLNLDGTLDTAFNPNANDRVLSIAVQADGRVLAGGDFTNIGGQTRNRIARLDATTGAADSFNPNANGAVSAIAVQADGRVLAGGGFTGEFSIGGATRNFIARLNPDGTADEFNPNASNLVQAIAVQADGKILVGGAFASDTSMGGQTRNHIARLETDGRLDQTLDLNIDGTAVYATAVQPDGKILIGGRFTTVLGVPRNNIARLNTDGTLDTAFDPNANRQVNAIAVQKDGKILVGGAFRGEFSIGGNSGQMRNRIARLEATGAVDLTFDPNADGDVNAIAVQADGMILLGGSFSTLNPNFTGAVTRISIARLEATTGAVDLTFEANAGGDGVNAIVVQWNGDILVGGSFTGNIGGQSRHNILRLEPNTGAVDPTFNPNANGYVNAIAVQADDRILVGGNFNVIGGKTRKGIARLDATTGLVGSIDSPDPFDPSANSLVTSIAVQADGKILVGGYFSELAPNGGAPVTRNSIARLEATGLVDSFNPNADSAVTSIAVQADGRVLAGGTFTNIGGQPRNLFARLSNDTAALQDLDVAQAFITWTRGGSSPHLTRATFEYSTDNVNYSPLSYTTPDGSNWALAELNLSTGQNIYIRARGYYRSGNNNGSESIAESVRNAFLAGSTPTPPDTTIDSGPAEGSTVAAASATFTFSSNEAGSTFQCQLDDGGSFAACTSPMTYSDLPDGSHKFSVQARDVAGNTDPSPATRKWTVDTTGPVPIIDSGPSNPTASTSATFTFHGTDVGSGVAGFECKVDTGLFAACTSGKNYTGLVEGSHTFQVKAIDNLGNFTLASYTWLVVTTAPAGPSANGEIAFATNRDGNREIYVMNPDGSGQTRLTNNVASDTEPVWSADGTKLALTSNRDGNSEIYKMNADGTGQTRLTTNPAEDSGAAWSPDGSQIAFVSGRDGQFEIYLMNADGTNQTRLTNSPLDDFDPAWSPDGQHIAFVSARDGNLEIYSMDPNGGNQVRITNSHAHNFEPMWSPDGTKIAFTRFEEFVFNFEIYVMDADGSKQTRLTTNFTDDYNPAWSPDGTKLVFTSTRNGNRQLYLMNANDGSNQTRTTTNLSDDFDPNWQAAFTISGQVADAGKIGLGGVTMALTASGSQSAVAITNPSGNYSFAVQAGGNYTVTPAKAGYNFNPVHQKFNNLNANQTANFSAMAEADLLLEVSAPDQVATLDKITYTFTITNHGPLAATGVLFTQELPANVAFVSITPSQGSCQPAALTCTLGEIASNGTATVVTRITAPNAVTTVKTTADVSSNEIDQTPGNNQVQKHTDVKAVTDLSLTETSIPKSVFVGDVLTYQIKVKNLGPNTAHDVVITGTTTGLASVILSTTQGSCSQSSGAFTCNFNPLLDSGLVTITVQGVPQASATGNLSNSAQVTSSEIDSNPANNSANVNTIIYNLPRTGNAFLTVKTIVDSAGDPTPREAGDFQLRVNKHNGFLLALIPGSELETQVLLTADTPGADTIFVVQELNPDSDYHTDFQCDGDRNQIGLNEVKLRSGVHRRCTITNTYLGTRNAGGGANAVLKIVKTVDNTGAPKALAKQPGDFTIDVKQTLASGNLLLVDASPGSANGVNVGIRMIDSSATIHVSEEQGDTNYIATFSGDCNGNGRVLLPIRAKKVCTVTNVYVGPHDLNNNAALKVVKKVDPFLLPTNHLQPSAFQLSVRDTQNNNLRSFPGSENGVNLLLSVPSPEPSGFSFLVQEDINQGFVPTFSDDCAGTTLAGHAGQGVVDIRGGETKNCTVTNRYVGARDDNGLADRVLKFKFDVDNTGSPRFRPKTDFHVFAHNIELPGSDVGYYFGDHSDVGLFAPKQFNYAPILVCSDQPGLPVMNLGANHVINIGPGEFKTCKVTFKFMEHTFAGGQLLNVIQLVDNSGAPSPPPPKGSSDFTLTLESGGQHQQFQGSSSGTLLGVGFSLNAFTVSSAEISGYFTTRTGNCDGTDPRQTMTCTLTSSYIGSHNAGSSTNAVLKVISIVDSTGAPAPAQPGDFQFAVKSGPTQVATFAGSSNGINVGLNTNAGEAKVEETGGPSNYTVSFSGDCTPIGVTINAGEDRVCTVTNTFNGSRVTTPTGSNVGVQSGNVNINFGNVSAAGGTIATQLNPSAVGKLPGTFKIADNLAFEITTTASVSAPITVCFNVPNGVAATAALFNALQVLHFENGQLVDRTLSHDFRTRTICAQTDSLSPFAVAEQIDGSLPSISGRVTDHNGNGVGGLKLNLSGSLEQSDTTDADGNYSFVNLTPGGDYAVTPNAPGYFLTPSNALFNGVNNDKSADFSAVNVQTVKFDSAVNQVPENGGVASVTVSRPSGTEGQVTVDYATSDDTAHAGIDYTATAGTVTFADGVASQTIAIPIINNALLDGNRTLNLTLSNPSDGLSINVQNPVALTILDDEGLSATASGFGRTVALGNISVTYQSVTSDGFTSAIPIDPNSAGPAPNGYTITGPAYDITTSATYTAPVSVCFNLPLISDQTTFSHLKVLHGELNASNQLVLVDRTTGLDFASRTLCSSVSSLSPFVIAQSQAPTAAQVTISGQLTTGAGVPVSGVNVALSGTQTAFTVTDSLGHYSFENIATGSSYTVTPSLVNYTFTPASRTFSLIANKLDAVFTAIRDAVPSANPLDTSSFFVRQHYLDFLGREPDPNGLAFWTNEITSCGAIQTCIEAKRINVSAAFFLSIEFQETGFLVYRTYKSAYGNLPGTPVPLRLNEFTPDTQKIGQGVVVGVGDWQTQLENNKNAFTLDFVTRSRFTTAYPTTLTPSEFVDGLYAKTGVTPSATERSAAIGEFGATGTSADPAARAHALRRVAENSTFSQQEVSRAFVLMEYFGYLRRNPNDSPDTDFSGYDFWLNKLNQFNGNFVNAEMVKAFLVSTEYRRRFGP